MLICLNALQIINGHFVKLRQLDKDIVADALEIVPPHNCLKQIWRGGAAPQAVPASSHAPHAGLLGVLV